MSAQPPPPGGSIGGGGGGSEESPAFVSGKTFFTQYQYANSHRYARLLAILLMAFFMAAPLMAQSDCQKYVNRVGERKHRLSAMPSLTEQDRIAKRDSARALKDIILSTIPCDGALAWSRFVLLNAYTESLWPDLSEAWEFAEAVRTFARTLPLVEEANLGQYHEWLGRVYLDYALYEARHAPETGVREPIRSPWYRKSLDAYNRAEAIYGAKKDRKALTYWQIVGYRAEVYAAGGDSLRAYCDWRLSEMEAPGASEVAVTFRAKMRRLIGEMERRGMEPMDCSDFGAAEESPGWLTLAFVALGALVVGVGVHSILIKTRT